MISQEKILAYLKEEQLNAGLSYEQLEKKTGIGHSSIQRYFTGTTKKVPITDLDKICDAMGIDLASLIIAIKNENNFPERVVLHQICDGVPGSNVHIAANVLRQFLPAENK